MNKEEKYEKCLKFIKGLYRLRFDTLVSIHEAASNRALSEEAEAFLKQIGEFESDKG